MADQRLSTLREAVRRAAAGQQREVLPEFLDLASGDDPFLAWVGAAAALPAMWWMGFAGEASDMLERVVLRFGKLADSAELPAAVPFETAVAAGALYDGTAGVDRLAGMADALPGGNALAGRLWYAMDRMVADGPAVLMPGPALREPRPMFGGADDLAAREVRSLTPEETELLWRQAAGSSRADVLIRLYGAGVAAPPEVPVLYPLADALRAAGRIAEGEQVLLDARPYWRPADPWDTLPATPPLHPNLRQLVTEQLRESYLSKPVAAGWW
jgi:hypothetical protein